MISYIIRRILLMFPTVIGITIVVFTVMSLSPGGIGGSLLSEEGAMRPEEREARRRYLNARFGLDQPPPIQYLRWLNKVSPIGFRTNADGSLGSFGFKYPDLGRSFVRERPVVDMVADALPVTLLLNLLTIPIIYSVAVSSGIYTAARKGSLADVGLGVVYIALWSLPTMWAGVMIVGFLANRDIIQLFPTGGLNDPSEAAMTFLPTFSGGFQRGWLLDRLWHLVGPVICMTYGGFAFLSKLMRATVLENLSADFVRTARAKGVAEKQILFRHVLRNSILPLITVAAGILPGLLGGSIIIERIFSLNGMGNLAISAIEVRDAEVVLSITLVISIISTFSLLLADLCYAVADPRVSYE